MSQKEGPSFLQRLALALPVCLYRCFWSLIGEVISVYLHLREADVFTTIAYVDSMLLVSLVEMKTLYDSLDADALKSI
jgi:hypothetical protein